MTDKQEPITRKLTAGVDANWLAKMLDTNQRIWGGGAGIQREYTVVVLSFTDNSGEMRTEIYDNKMDAVWRFLAVTEGLDMITVGMRKKYQP